MKCWKFHETDLGQKVENDPEVAQYETISDNKGSSGRDDGTIVDHKEINLATK